MAKSQSRHCGIFCFVFHFIPKQFRCTKIVVLEYAYNIFELKIGINLKWKQFLKNSTIPG